MTITKHVADLAKKKMHSGEVKTMAQGVKAVYAEQKGKPHTRKPHKKPKKKVNKKKMMK